MNKIQMWVLGINSDIYFIYLLIVQILIIN
jgi:hypothetical protein